MRANLLMALFKNDRGAIVGDLYRMEERVLACSHPATLAAACYAMGVEGLYFCSEKGVVECSFPLLEEDLPRLAALLSGEDEAHFMSGFATFSLIDFANPPSFDNQASIHWRAAAYHLPVKYLKNAPLLGSSKRFKKELRERNRFIYFPYC